MHTNKDSGGGGGEGGGVGGETCGEQTLIPPLNATGRSNPASPSRAPALKAFHPGPSLLLSGWGWVRAWVGGRALIDWLGFFFFPFFSPFCEVALVLVS